MSTILLVIVLFLVIELGLEILVESLNLKTLDQPLPKEVADVYDPKEYKKSQAYSKTNTYFGLIQAAVSLAVLFLALSCNIFETIDLYLRMKISDESLRGVAYLLILGGLLQIISLPFSLYKTFVIEERFGFNKTTVKTFMFDLVKGSVLGVMIASPLLYAILWFFQAFGTKAWMIAWLTMMGFQCVMMLVVPIVIMPLFNRFEPIKEKGIKDCIMAYAKKVNFPLKEVFQMDGSKRSKKSNAFFTGIGKFKRVVLFDTLIEQQSPEALRVIVAHEVGHYKKKHIYKMMLITALSVGLMLYLFGLAIETAYLSQAFGFSQHSIYASLLVFSFLYQPISTVTSMMTNALSRKHEYEADAFAAETTGDGKILIEALKRLSKDNLSHLTPHPLKVFLDYSHPTLIQRIKALN
ncbi:MAG: M48 family metallopeptidase [bacterium]